LVMVILWSVLWLGMRRRERIPGRAQVAVEQFVSMFDNLVASSLELETKERNRAFVPLIASLFIFLLMANYMGFFPSPIFEEPTADINCTLALGIMAIAIATYCGVKAKGAKGYFEELLGPMWNQEGATGAAKWAGKASALFFFPLNIIGELAKVVSISFRLFGNIIGGAIIIVVVATLIFH